LGLTMGWINVENLKFDEFCDKHAIKPRAQLLDWNRNVLGQRSKIFADHVGAAKSRTTWLDGIDRLWVPADGEPDEAPAAEPDSPHTDLLKNRSGWWAAADRRKQFLAYETLRNADRFIKGPGRTQVGLYTAPLKRFRIEMDECVLTDDRFKLLREAVFPTLDDADKLRARANVNAGREIRVMNGQPFGRIGADSDTLNLARDVKNKAARSNHVVVMPYNYEDNGSTSEAIGTTLEASYKKLGAEWFMWKSASRSSFVEIEMVDHEDVVDASGDPWPWKYDARKAPGRLQPHLMDNPFDMSSFDPARHFSVKTGVEWVGQQYQGNVTGQRYVNQWGDGAVTPGKDKIEKNSVVAMLRSYLIRQIDAKHRYKPDFGSQLEILTVNSLSGGDGFQVRDLGCFTKSLVPFPALSVPYAGLEIMQTAGRVGFEQAEAQIRFFTGNEFAEDYLAAINDDVNQTREQRNYALFWGAGYALMVAAVKAGLLLRYAIVPVTPNPQNFIIELTGTGVPSRPIVRDVGDFLLHHEIAAAYWLAEPSWRQCGGVIPKDLGAMKFDNDLIGIEYSAKVAQHYADDLEMSSGVLPYDSVYHVIAGQKAGNILNWGNNSTFKSWGGADWKTLGSPLTNSMMARWGALHNEVFMKLIEDEVGIDLSALRRTNRVTMLNLPAYGQTEEEQLFPDLQAALTTADSLRKFRAHAAATKIR